jgi:hypothetical protein
VLALRGVRIDGTSPAHAADRLDDTPTAPADGRGLSSSGR